MSTEESERGYDNRFPSFMRDHLSDTGTIHWFNSSWCGGIFYHCLHIIEDERIARSKGHHLPELKKHKTLPVNVSVRNTKGVE